MPNVDAPNGLRAVGTMGSAGYVGRVQAFQTSTSDTQAICVGDPVIRSTTAMSATGLNGCTRLTTGATTAILGVCVGVQPTPTDLNASFRKASSNQVVYVDTDPNTIYEVADSMAVSQTTFITSSVATTAMSNYNYQLLMNTVDTTAGNGKAVISSTTGTTTTYNVKVIGISPKVGNEIGLAARWLVLINNHAYRGVLA